MEQGYQPPIVPGAGDARRRAALLGVADSEGSLCLPSTCNAAGGPVRYDDIAHDRRVQVKERGTSLTVVVVVVGTSPAIIWNVINTVKENPS